MNALCICAMLPLKIESLSTFFVRPCIIKKISMVHRLVFINAFIFQLLIVFANRKCLRFFYVHPSIADVMY